MKNILKYFLFLLFLVPVACEEEKYEIGAPASEANLTIERIEGDANRVTLIANTGPTPSLKKWDLGNGSTLEGDTVTAYFPFKGEYTITLTAYSRGGTTTSTSQLIIEETDPEICNDELLRRLTGGCDKPEGKKWVVAATTAGHFGLGPLDAMSPIWYAAGPNEKAGGGLYDDSFTFQLVNYQADFETNGNVYINGGQAPNFAGATPSPVGDFTAPYNAPEGLSYVIQEENGSNFLIINGGGFIGYYTGVSRYQIITLEENLLFLKYYDTVNDFSWFLRLIPEGTTPPPPPPPATSTLPITFEGATAPPFNGFGGSTYEVVDNPSSTGINTSAKVGKYVKGRDGSWAGIETTLNAPLDFSSNTVLKYKVYSPVTGRALFKIEKVGESTTFVEVFAEITKTNEWQELTFDFSGAASGTYNKIALFLDFDNNNGGTFYIDDIRFNQPPVALPLTFETLQPPVEAFGGSTYEYVDNPETTGINTSSRVLKTVHGDQTWAGLFIQLTEPLDLSTQTTLSVKVWAPTAGTIRLKLENANDNTDFVEIDAEVPTAEEWVEVTFDVSSAPTGRFAKVVLFPGWDVANAGTFYLDDITLK